jgi:thiol-disulfide isomerase/thioredoxin
VQRVVQGVVIALALVACRRKEEPPKGDILATLEAPMLDGAKFDASTLKGKPTLLMFVSPTCPHCLDQIPRADRVAKEKNANAVAVFIVGKAENAKGVVEHTKFGGPVLIDDGSLRRRYGVRAVPYTLVLGPDGHAREALRGAQETDVLADAVDDAR